ncbi:WD40-repeat-containing domain protein [Halteromyces radiatus]|uniref:WD40-repeat-containing domain protein n=1 Tax=Halteromyces radiatus TaxID=101107 RepID=UPI002220C7CC|nr:WD40-repeat-containing domain protein [Halteromyces radiatus]KAI8084436.1 WD40-repeat-containing domain protein [Halteromyces radiatus]
MLTEIAITASNTDPTVYVWDIRSGSTLFSFKQSTSGKSGLCCVPRPGAPLQIGSFLTAQTDRATLHVYDWRRDHIAYKMLTPEKIITVTASHQGHYVAGATSSGRVYLWHTATGHLKCVFDAHYRLINRLVFSNDDTALITAGDDATVNVWLMSQLLCSETEAESRPSSMYSWADHTLPVTDVCIGSGTLSTARVYTSSLDSTVKLWDLSTGELLTTFLFPKAVSAITLNPSETILFAAYLYRRRQHQAYNNTQSVGGLGKVEAVGVHESVESSTSSLGAMFSGHTGSINSLDLSFDGTLLISGSNDGNCIVWDVASRQSLRKFTSHKGPVTSVSCILRPNELLTGATQHKYIPMPWKPFKRTVTMMEEERQRGVEQQIFNTQGDYKKQQELVDVGPAYSSLSCEMASTSQIMQELMLLDGKDNSMALQAQLVEVQDELARLHGHHGKMKSLHDSMYHTLVDQFMADQRKNTVDQEDE